MLRHDEDAIGCAVHGFAGAAQGEAVLGIMRW
jgi:hypothetical protein